MRSTFDNGLCFTGAGQCSPSYAVHADHISLVHKHALCTHDTHMLTLSNKIVVALAGEQAVAFHVCRSLNT